MIARFINTVHGCAQACPRGCRMHVWHTKQLAHHTCAASKARCLAVPQVAAQAQPIASLHPANRNRRISAQVRSNISESSTHGDLNQMDPKGPWAACARHITGDLFANEGAHAVAPKAFAKGFCDMVLRPSPPTFWTNSARDG